MNNKPTAVVIGAGIGGMASAIRLRAKGADVTVLEASGGPGGKMKEIRREGFRFDSGPSLFTLPELVDDLFKAAGKRREDYFSYRKMPIITRYFYEDGTEIDAHADPKDFAREIEEKTGEAAERVHAFLAHSRTQYELTENIFLKSSLHKFSTYANWDALRTLFQLPKLETHLSMAKAIGKRFEDERVRQLFQRYATYNGSDPHRAPATLNVIPHLEHNVGAFFAEGGMFTIAQSLFRLAKDIGVEFRFDTRAEEILTEKGRVRGVAADGTILNADIVVSNADVVPTYRNLLPREKAPERTLRQERSSSALIFYWGIEGEFPRLATHNILFSDDYAGEFEALFGTKTLHSDPTVYIYASCKENEGDAPAGHENWFTMINAPHLNGQDWDELIPKARKSIQEKVKRMLGIDLTGRIKFEEVLDPRGIQSATSSHLGALYGSASNNKFAAFLRHPNFSGKIKGLYFAGGSVHPGGGVPLCLLSAKIISDLIP